MKKSLILAFACTLLMGNAAFAQTQQETTYVEDPAQGYLMNSFSDNWFITAEGGVGIYFSKFDQHRNVWDRFMPAASIYAGKWFSPIAGMRLGASYFGTKGLSEVDAWARQDEPIVNGYYKQRFNHFGGVGDFMLNLTNWWCGYKPGRIYNATLYAGAGAYITFAKAYSDGESQGYKNAHDGVLAVRAGLINSFRVHPNWQVSLDLRYTAMNNHRDVDSYDCSIGSNVQAFLGVTYLVKKNEWAAPIVPVYPEPENCDALRARLASADARIADLEQQLRDCLNRPATVQEVNDAPLATIYYPINQYRLTRQDARVLKAVSYIMIDNSDKKYVITGYADNYTGTDEYNTRLRHNRANGVKNQLVKYGVSSSQLDATVDNNNLCDLGEKFVSLDRAVTIKEAK